MAKNFKLIKDNSTLPLKKLNEGQELKNPDKYVFLGVFTQCSTPDHKIVNRNGRIYQEKEVLRHLGYLREMIKENNGRILGELDHPEGRFDVQMKEASHAITDLWYDDKTKCVMGRLEVLDTPNGKTLKSIIDAGFPLYVSSRAAGDVDERTKEVEIAQIFTYDVVCTPGFKEARLERVDESLNLSAKALKYMNESISTLTDANDPDVEVPASAINESIANFKVTSVKSLCNPLLESDEEGEEKEEKKEKKVKVIKKVKKEEPKEEKKEGEEKEEKKDECGEDKADGKEELNDVKSFYPVMGTSAKEVNEEGDDEDKPADSEGDASDTEAPAEGEESDENSEEGSEDAESSEDSESGDSEEGESSDGEKEELSDEEKEKNRKLILDVKGLDSDGEELASDEDSEDKSGDIENIEGEDEEESSDEEGEGEEKKDDSDEESSEDEETNEEEEPDDAETCECNGQCEKKDKIKKETEEDIAELNSILASVEKSESVKESIVRRYPFAISLSESNFAKFASLRPKLKKRCADFIEENQIFDIRMINELWNAPLREDKKMQENWLKLASQEDIDLYVAAPVEVQNAIEESAKLWILETQEDVDNFWESTGLRQAAYKKAMNEKFIKDYQHVISEAQVADRFKLGYDIDIINSMEQWYKD